MYLLFIQSIFADQNPKHLQNYDKILDIEQHFFVLINLSLLLSFNKSAKILWIKSKNTTNIGVACQLGQAGSTVYITGRSVDKLAECAEVVQKRGGKAISVPTGALHF